MTAPRLIRKQTVSVESSTGDWHGLSVDLTLDQAQGVSLAITHYGDVADHIADTTHTLFGVLPGTLQDGGKRTNMEVYRSPAEFLEFVAAMNALAAELPAMIEATQYESAT